MFGQDQSQDAQNGQGIFGQPDNNFGGSAPAPGAPAGPINGDTPAPDGGLFGSSVPASAPSDAATTVPDDLLDIKQEALQALTPLVGHLEQTPEEKFRTTMMMIQASDNQDLLKDAYDAAQKIEDEKARAQALLDVVNEINYFTQQHHN